MAEAPLNFFASWPFARVPRALLIVGAALAVRILALLLQGPNAIDWDGANFVRTADNLLHGHGYVGMRGTTNAIHAPLYPLLIAALSALVGHGEACALVISIIAGAVFAGVIYGVTKRAFDEPTALVAAAIVAIHPILVGLSVQVLADQFAFTLEFAGLYFFLRWLDSGRLADLAGCGTVLSLAYLSRSEALLDVPIVAAALCALGWRTPRRLAGTLLSFLLPCVLLITPYVAFLTAETGRVRLEAKTPINYAIGVRIQQGMGYVEAADGLGPGGREVGAELGDGYYVTHRNAPDPTLSERVAFALRGMPNQLRALARLLASRHYGSPVLLLLALAGAASGFRSRRRAVRNGLLLAVAAGKLLAIATVAHFWDRYAAPFAPFMAIWGAAGIVACADAIVRRFPAFASAAFRRAGWVFVAVLVAYIEWATVRDLRVNALDPRPLAATGHWIAANLPHAHMIMAVTPLVPYYAGDIWNALPWATSEEAAIYVRHKHPALVVLEPRELDRTYLAAWRRDGIPGSGGHLVYTSGGAPAYAVRVYALP